MPRITLNALVGKVARVAWTGVNQFKASTRNLSTTTGYKVCGIDTVDGVIYVNDTGNGHLKISENQGTSWSTNKGFPSDVTTGNASKVIRFGDYIYLLAKATSTGLVGIWRATPTSGNTALTWSGPLLTAASGTTVIGPAACDLNADASYLYYGEYGDPAGGPSLYRISLADANGAGTNWVTILTETTAAGYRHIHGVFPDPYNAGHVWLASGDGVTEPLRRSTDYGATWVGVTAQAGGLKPQVCQVSFTPNKVWCVSDANWSDLIVVDKTTLDWVAAHFGQSWNIPVPSRSAQATWNPASLADGAMTSTTVTLTGVSVGYPTTCSFTVALPAGMVLSSAATAVDTVTVTLVNHSGSTQDLASGTVWVSTTGGSFDASPFFGIVDPSTGVFYFATPSSTTAVYGALFCIPYAGGPVILLDYGPTMAGECFIYNSQLWHGAYHRALLTKDEAFNLAVL